MMPDDSTKATTTTNGNLLIPTGDAGCAQFGNFINYYSFNSAEERLRLMTTTTNDIWSALLTTDNNTAEDSTLLILDIGCNAGNFTQLFYKFICDRNGAANKSVHVLGIDLDAGLIARAIEHNVHGPNVSYACVDIMNVAETDQIAQYLRKFQRTSFDVVCCLSLTMWIHLNHGDDGLLQFLDAVDLLAGPKMLIIEPQPWKCYTSAVRRMKKADKGFERFASLRMRKTIENDIEHYLETKRGRCKVFVTVPTNWGRRIAFYKK